MAKKASEKMTEELNSASRTWTPRITTLFRLNVIERHHESNQHSCMGKPPLPAFVLQLEEARAEWRRRSKGPGLSSASCPA